MKYHVLWLLWFAPFSYGLTGAISPELKGIEFQLAGDYEEQNESSNNYCW